MTMEEAIREVERRLSGISTINSKIADEARVIIPVLLDSGRVNSAKPLQELFFELDSKNQELIQLIEMNPAVLLEVMKRK